MARAASAALIAAAPAASALGQTGTGGTITSGNWVFAIGDCPTDRTGAGPASTDLYIDGASGTDHIYQSWWWYRVNNVDTREYCLANATVSNWSGDTGVQDFTVPSFTARATWRIEGLAPNAAKVTATLVITNTTASPLDVTLFQYHDFDYGGDAPGDTGTLVSPHTIQVRQPTASAPFGTLLGYYLSEDADAYRVTVWAVLRGLLTNTLVDNLDNSGLPFGPDDWTGAYQFNRTIPAGESAAAQVVFGIGPTIPSAGCPGDFNDSGTVTVQDIFDFLIAYFAGSPSADVNGQNGVTVQDIFDFLIAYFAGCP